MKKRLLSILALLPFTQANAQTFETLDHNNVKAGVNVGGLLFKNFMTGDPAFEVPKDRGSHALAGSNIVIGGQLGGSILHLAASDLNFMTDYQPGPVNGPGVASTNPVWNRVWKISVGEINYHIAHYTDPGYVPAPIIAQWPANGNPTYGEMAVRYAPFHDNDGDMVYEPMDGDYPVIKGTQAIYQVFNDLTTHATTGGQVGVEIRAMAYVFGCTQDSALNNTVFVHYEIINRSTSTYADTYIGINSNLQVGNPTDNYAGCDVARGMYFGYNADSTDEADVFTNNYGDLLPAQGITILRGPYADPDGINNPITSNYAAAIAAGGIPYEALGTGYGSGDTIVDNEQLGLKKFMATNNSTFAPMQNPVNGSDFYNVLKGLWRDGSQPVWGGSGYPGHPGTTTTAVDYLYYADTDSSDWASRGVPVPTNWREQYGLTTPSGRNTMGSCGPFSLAPGAYNEVDVAFTFARSYTVLHDPLGSVPLLQQRVDSIRHYFNSGTTPCGDFVFNSISENKTQEVAFDVYPNPVSDVLRIRFDVNSASAYNIHDISGRQVLSGQLTGNSGNIDVSLLKNGIYMINIAGAGTQKFVVQH